MSQIQELLKAAQVIKPQSTDSSKKTEGGKEIPNVSFGETVGNFLKEVNESSKVATNEVADVIQGNSENLTEAMVKSQEAKINFELLLEIRNKLLESYKEVQRMQI